MSEIRFTSPVASGSLAPVKLTIGSPVQTGGRIIPPASYSISPWTIGNGTWLSTPSSSIKTSTDPAYGFNRMNGIYTESVRLSARLAMPVAGEQWFGLGSSWNEYHSWKFESTNFYCRAWTTTWVNLWTSLSVPSTNDRFALAFDKDTNTRYWYMNDTLITSSTQVSEDCSQAMVYAYAGTSGRGFTDISITDLSGSTTPLLPQSTIKFK